MAGGLVSSRSFHSREGAEGYPHVFECGPPPGRDFPDFFFGRREPPATIRHLAVSRGRRARRRAKSGRPSRLTGGRLRVILYRVRRLTSSGFPFHLLKTARDALEREPCVTRPTPRRRTTPSASPRRTSGSTPPAPGKTQLARSRALLPRALCRAGRSRKICRLLKANPMAIRRADCTVGSERGPGSGGAIEAWPKGRACGRPPRRPDSSPDA